MTDHKSLTKRVRVFRVFTLLGTLVAVVVVIVVAFIMDARNDVLVIEGLDSQLEKLYSSVYEFRQKDGVAMGCYNTPQPIQVPALGPKASVTDIEKINALRDYEESAWNLARTYDSVVKRDEQEIRKISVIPDAVSVLPWMRDRYVAALNRLSQRVAFAKAELSDRSCSKR